MKRIWIENITTEDDYNDQAYGSQKSIYLRDKMMDLRLQ